MVKSVKLFLCSISKHREHASLHIPVEVHYQ